MKELRAIKTLEFDKILENLKTKCESDLGREVAESTDISISETEINNRLKETDEAVDIIDKKGAPPLFGIHDIKEATARLDLGGTLGARSLLNVADFLRVSRLLKKYIEEEDDEGKSHEIIEDMASLLFTSKQIEDRISECIISEDEISDSASPKLRQIRRNIFVKNKQIREKLDSIVNSGSKYLQDNIVTMREGRYVIPVKSENKNKIKGLVHDMSATGQTAYIEPIAVVNLNNELKTLEIEEREEIERILAELSAYVSDYSLQIKGNQDILSRLDFIFAKAKLAIEMEATKPKINNDLSLKLFKARHPLLKKNEVVPIDISLGKEFTSLIITGPNTGGKTVTLKTVGLLNIMAQYGLFIPAEEGAQVGIFDKIFSDIGDEQSIEQSLSTFSSHMVNIVNILENADERSLVLFDELGAGTDPTEGAALARSIMDFMLERKIRCISTTHYNQLKTYALTTEGVQNASMEFDVDTLRPTYRLIIGIPGKSNAFLISKRLGLRDDIIEDAKKQMSQDSIEFEKVLENIEKDRWEIEKHRSEAELYKIDLEKQNKRLEEELASMKEKREDILEKARREARQIINRAKEESELALSEIKDVVSEVSKDQARRLQESQDLIRENLNKASKKDKILIEAVKNPAENIKPGETVMIASLNAKGTVLELPDSNGDVLVQAGMMKMKVKKEAIIRIDDEESSKSSTKNIIKHKSRTATTEIDVRGRNFDDAKVEVDKFLDDSYLSGLKSVRIIHGKGTMVLREKLRADFKKNKYIKSFDDASYNEGGNGVTVVTFKWGK